MELNMLKTFGILGGVILVIALVVISPLFTIWSLNVLFPSLAIDYTLNTWAAAAILTAVFSGGLFSTKK
jgi:hypothetical protein